MNPAILWSEELCRSRRVSYSSRYSSKSSCNQSSRIFAALSMLLGRTSAISFSAKQIERCPHLFGVFEKCALNTLTRFLAINELPANKIGWRGACDRYSNWYRSIDLFATYAYVACVTDETKLWLSPSAKQRQNHCSGVPPVYQNICQSGWKEILPVIR